VQAAHELERLERGELLVEERTVGDEAGDRLDRQRVLAKVVTVDQHLPARGLDEPRDDAHGGALARAVGSEEPEHLAVAHVEREAADGLEVAVALV